MARPPSWWWVLAILVASAGCATTGQAPDRARVATSITERSGFETSGLSTPSREWTAPPNASLTDGLAIDEAVSIALWNNPDFQVALASLGLARADLLDAGLLRNPVFSLLFPWGPKQLEFTLTWPIDALWQRPRRINEARLNADVIAEQLVSNGLRVVSDVRLAFLDVLVADRRLAFTLEQAAIANEAARLADGQLRAGDISELEAKLARTDALRLEAVRLTRVTARDTAIVRLRALLGLSADAAPLQLTEPAVTTADTCRPGSELLPSALAARPDVRAAELQIEAAGARAGVERSRILTFTASLDANAKGSEGFEIGPGVAIELPILSRNQGRIARANAEMEQAARHYLAVRAHVATEVQEASVALTEARTTAQLLGDDVTASLVTAKRQAEGLFTAGEVSLLNLLLMRQRLMDIEATRIDAAFGVNRAIVKLEQALGRSCGAR